MPATAGCPSSNTCRQMPNAGHTVCSACSVPSFMIAKLIRLFPSSRNRRFREARAFFAAASDVAANGGSATFAKSLIAPAASVHTVPRKTSVRTSRLRSLPVSTTSPAFVLSMRPSPFSSVETQ